ncbi:MAG: DUF1552 domain-containing protein [Gemmataceae bacterium]
MAHFFAVRKAHLSRRAFLRGAGAALGLPLLDAMLPACATAAEKQAAQSPRRFVAMQYGLGFHAPYLVPKTPGADYKLTPYLELVKDHRPKFTIISGVAHPEQRGANGHSSEMTWLTGARHPGLPGFRNSMSFDQYLATQIGNQTRFPFLSMSAGGRDGLSWTANGINLDAETSPSQIFTALFVQGTPNQIKAQVDELRRGRSILDTVQAEAKALEKSLGQADRQKLGQYFTAVRDLEKRMHVSEAWATKPKPKVDVKPPVDVADRWDILANTRLMHDLIALALQTDSTRVIAYKAGGFNPVPKIPGVQTGWHDLSHHGQDANKISELKIIEEAEFREINRFFGLLTAVKEVDGTLLDHTAVLLGSNLSNASSHDPTNLPILLAGGGFKHGSHLAFDSTNNAPFAGLFVSIAQRLGIQTDRFAYATKPLTGLEAA